MTIFQAKRYLYYLCFASNRHGHGIHSPFIFDLVSETFRNKTRNDVVFTIEQIRRQLRSDEKLITVTDLGSGSSHFNKKERRVSDIARYSAVSAKYGLLLHNLATKFGNGSIIEFGTSFGISTMYLAAGSSASVVYTMEGCPECSYVARKNFSEAGLQNIRLMTGSFEDQLPFFFAQGINPGLVYIDGNHRKEPVLNYFSKMLELALPDTVIILDDIHSSREMEESWIEIKNNPAVTSSIDIFRMGIVFIRPGMTRNHYIIRY